MPGAQTKSTVFVKNRAPQTIFLLKMFDLFDFQETTGRTNHGDEIIFSNPT
jgi:hypothetical protein